MKIRPNLVLCAFGVLASVAYGQDTVRMVEVSNFVPHGVLSAKALGPKPPSDVLHLAIGVKPANLPGLQAFTDSVSNPKSPNYRHFLTPVQIGQIYGLPTAHINNIIRYLVANGMRIKLIGKNRLSILADATVSQASKAFGTSFERYEVSQPGKSPDTTYFCFTTPPSVPTGIAADIQSISGTQNFIRPHHNNYYSPQQFQLAYTVSTSYNAGYQGQGRTIGISNWDGYLISNEQAYVSCWSLPTPVSGAGTNITIETIDGGSGTGNEEGEGDLDMQTTIGMAPLCNLIVYDGAGSDLANVLTQEADNDECDIITTSYSWDYLGATPEVETLHALQLSMSAEGITYMAASGDRGTAISNYDFPNIEPEVLSVGGTSLQTKHDGSRSSETGWSSYGDMGGGGWVQTVDPSNVRPGWQTGTGLDSFSAVPYRLTPDIAFDADPNYGYVVFGDFGSGYNGWIFGGTSAASPNCAGSLAVSEEQLIALGALTADANGNTRMGRVQDLLYWFNGDPTVFYDVTSGTNGTLPNGNTSTATTGWDTDSGWGPIIWSGFVARIAGFSELSSLSFSPATVVDGNSSTGTVTLNQAAPAGGQPVFLTSSQPNVTVPASITVAAGATSATFTASTASGLTTSYSATITASTAGSSQSGTLSVLPDTVTSVTLTPTTIGGLGTSTATVTLSSPAPIGGWLVGIHAGAGGYLNMPSSITVPTGSTTATFTITGTAQRPSTINMGIFASDNTSSAEAILTIQGDSLTSFSLSPSQIKWTSGTSMATLTIASAAPTGGWNVTLTPGVSGYVNMPTSVTIPAGSTTATFSITGNALRFFTLNLGIIANDGGSNAYATLTIAGDAVTGITLNPSTIGWGGTSTATVKLVVAAPPGGWLVNTNPGASGYVSMPTSITVPAGATSATFSVTAGSQRSANLTVGIYANDGPSNQSAMLTIQGDSVAALSLSPSTIGWSGTSTATVTLASPAPSSGWALALHAGAPGYVSMPSSLTVPGGTTSATFTITGVSQRSGTLNLGIFASDGNTTQEAVITLVGDSIAGLTLSPSSVAPGGATTGTVTLNAPAPPGGWVVTLKTGAPAYVGVPFSVTVPAGSTSVAFTATTNANDPATGVGIVASDGGSSQEAILTIT